MEDIDDLNKWIKTVVVFYGAELLICVIINSTKYFQGLWWLFLTELSLGVLACIFVVLVWNSIRYVFRWHHFSFLKAAVYSMAAVMLAILVNIVIRWLNHTIFQREVHFYLPFRYLKYPRLSMFMLVVLLPAVFEEIAYRGVILESLLRLADRRRAILIAAILFAIIHMSLISFFWLVPFAIWLGNVRQREGTIWYGVIIHFFFNLTACLFEILV